MASSKRSKSELGSSSRVVSYGIPPSQPQNLGVFVSLDAKNNFEARFSKRSVAIERKVIYADLSNFGTPDFALSSGLEKFNLLIFQTNVALVRQFYANIHEIVLDPPSFKSSLNGNLFTVTPESIAGFFGLERPSLEQRATHPVLELSQAQLDGLFSEGMLAIAAKLFTFSGHIACTNFIEPARILHRILTGTVFAKNGSLSEVSQVHAFYVWIIMFNEPLDIGMLVWSQMVTAYDGPTKNCLPFGCLIRAISPAGVFTEDLQWDTGLSQIDKTTLAQMHIFQGPRVPDFQEEMRERVSRLEEMSTQMVEGVGSLTTRFEELFTMMKSYSGFGAEGESDAGDERDKNMED